VADAAHELKTPIAVLVGEAQDALRPEALPEERHRSLETIERTARGLAREADNLLLLAHGDAAPAPRRDVEDLAEIARESVAAAGPLGASRRVRFALSLESGVVRIRGDRSALFRLATNLVSNAALYTEPGTEVAITVAPRGDEVVFEVRDRGPGVPEEDRSRIFSRFVRLDAARDRNPEGSGLGLAIVEQVAQAHGGRIEVEHREGGGAVFRAVFPAAR
jgi:two-component system sensor histidine kinase TctE